MYIDPSGCFPVLACILGSTALVGMVLTICGVASDNNTLTAIGLGMVGVAALVSGGIIDIKVPGAKFSLKNFILYHFASTYFGIYPAKIFISYIKKKLKEKY